jgi:ABC-type enterochelin transport system ATPase subunit
MFVQMGTTLSRLTGITLGCVVYQKNVGITNCRRQLKLITSVKVGHSRTSVYSIKRFGEYPYSTEYSNDDIHTVISIKYLQLPQVF